MRKKRPLNTRESKLRANELRRLASLQTRYPFKMSLQYYMQGNADSSEASAQKAFVACLQAEFPEALGCCEVDGDIIFPALWVSTSDFYDPRKQRGSLQMQQFKRMGHQRGTADISILTRNPSRTYSGLVIECKSLTGYATSVQKKTLAFLAQQGFCCHVCRGYGEMLCAWLDYWQ